MLGDYVVIIKTLFSISIWKIKSISILVIFYDLPCTNLRHFLIVIMSTASWIILSRYKNDKSMKLHEN